MSTASSITCASRTASMAATRNFLGIRVLRAGAKFLQLVGLPAIEARVKQLTTYCLDLLRDGGLSSQTPASWAERAQIVNVAVPEAAGLMDVLREKHRVIVNVKDDMLRLSMNFFNTEEDIEKAVDAILRETGKKAKA